jgi:hypothetical protein
VGGVAMIDVTQVFEYRFPAEGLAIARINIDFDDLIHRLGLTLESWEEPGLGPARGAFIRLSSGRMILIQELEHLRKSMNILGPDIFADAGDVIAWGVGPLVDEVLAAFGLPKSAVAWNAGEDLRQVAADIVEFLRARNSPARG